MKENTELFKMVDAMRNYINTTKIKVEDMENVTISVCFHRTEEDTFQAGWPMISTIARKKDEGVLADDEC